MQRSELLGPPDHARSLHEEIIGENRGKGPGTQKQSEDLE